MNTARPRNNFVYLLIVIAIGAIIFTALRGQGTPTEDISLSQLADSINNGQVTAISVSGDDVRVTEAGGTIVTTRKDPSTDLLTQLDKLGVKQDALSKIQYSNERPPDL